jgi:outer membrane protein assembly factor BamB
LSVLVIVALATTISRAAEPEWPQFRGPGGLGVADASSLPERWSGTSNVAWRVDIPGRGWSSPVVWRGRVFVTTAVSSGAFKAPSTGIHGNDDAGELERQGLSEQEIYRIRNTGG